MRLPNCVTDFMKVNEEKMITEIHSMAAKLRMSAREVEENKEAEGGEKKELLRSLRGGEGRSLRFKWPVRESLTGNVGGGF